MIVRYRDEDFEYWYDMCYDQGFEDGLAGRPPCQDCGDMEEAYNAGYEDGVLSLEPEYPERRR